MLKTNKMKKFKKLIKECEVCKGIFGTHDDMEHIFHDLLQARIKYARMEALNKAFITKPIVSPFYQIKNPNA